MADTSSTQSIYAQQHFQNVAASYEKNAGGSTRAVAKHLVSLASPITTNSKILDNACGTGIVIDELLASITDEAVKQSLIITAVDASPAMIDILKGKAENVWNIPSDHLSAKALTAEDLNTIPAETYDYSFTNFGFVFFKDPSKAAGHVYRTLKPGGTAYITAWANLGYMRAVESAAEAIRPGVPKPKLPFGDEWFEMGHLEKLFGEAGFKDVDVSLRESRWSAQSVGDLAWTIGEVVGPLLKGHGWSDGEVGRLAGEMERTFEGDEEGLEFDGREGQVRLKMMANVAVCRK